MHRLRVSFIFFFVIVLLRILVWFEMLAGLCERKLNHNLVMGFFKIDILACFSVVHGFL